MGLGQLAQGSAALGRAGLKAGLNPLKGLFQPKPFQNSISNRGNLSSATGLGKHLSNSCSGPTGDPFRAVFKSL